MALTLTEPPGEVTHWTGAAVARPVRLGSCPTGWCKIGYLIALSNIPPVRNYCICGRVMFSAVGMIKIESTEARAPSAQTSLPDESGQEVVPSGATILFGSASYAQLLMIRVR